MTLTPARSETVGAIEGASSSVAGSSANAVGTAASNGPTLKKTFKPSWVFAMALGSAIGWGAFVLPFDWISSAGLAGTLIGFLIGGLVIAIIGLNYGVVVRHLPVTGGGVAYALATLGRVSAFIAGWCLTLGYTGIVALNASAVTLVFRVTLPDLVMRAKLYTVAGWDIYLPEVIIASLFILAFGYFNHRGSSLSGQFQFFAVVAMLVAVAVVMVSILVYFFTNDIELAPALPSGVSMTHAIIVILVFAPWAFVGFDTVPQLAGEFNFSPKKALALLLWGIGGATFIYMAMMVSTSIAVGTNSAAYADSAWPPAMAIRDIMGPIGLVLMLVGVTAGVLTGLNGFMTATSRVLFTMGRANMLPPSFNQLHPRFETPTVAIISTCAIALISPWFGRAALTWVVDMTSFGITVAYFFACATTFMIGRGKGLPGMRRAVDSSWQLTLLGATGCLLAITFAALLLVPASPGALGRESMIALVTWFVLGTAMWFACRRRYLSTSIRKVHREVLGRARR